MRPYENRLIQKPEFFSVSIEACGIMFRAQFKRRNRRTLKTQHALTAMIAVAAPKISFATEAKIRTFATEKRQ